MSSIENSANLIKRIQGTCLLARTAFGQGQYPYRSSRAIKADQSRNLRRILGHAVRTVPYYIELFRKLRLSPLDIKSAADLSRLPIIEPEDLRRKPEFYVSTAEPVQKYLKLRSAGSTGVPRTVYHDATSLFRSAAHGERSREAWKSLLPHRYGYRLAMIIPIPSSTLDLQMFWESHALLPPKTPNERRLYSLFEPPERLIPFLNEFRPDVIYSYGSYLDVLVHHLARTKVPFHLPRLVITSSSILSESSRLFLERDLGIPVFNAYQAVEALKIGFECEEHHGIHLNIDLYPVRIVDRSGRDLPAGSSGDVVFSNLVNRATILLNYRIGDSAAILPGTCSCGRTLPLLSWLDGRNDDCLEFPSGRIIHPQALCRIFREEPHICQYQLVHAAPDRIRVDLLALDICDQPEIRRRITNRLQEIVGPDISLDVEFVPSISPTTGGKRRAVISHCRSPLEIPKDGQPT